MNHYYLTAIFRSILTQILCVSGIIYNFQFVLENVISKNCKYIFFYKIFVHLGENTSEYCSQIIVVHSCNLFFLKFTQRVTILQMISNMEVTLKRLISMLRIDQSCILWCKVIYVRCINCSYNNVAKRICLLYQRHFCLYGKISCKQELLKNLSP